MQKLKILAFLLLLIFTFIGEKQVLSNNQDTLIQLKWNKAYTTDSINKSIIGLKWALSYLGASLPSSTHGISVSKNIITLNLIELAFNTNAIENLTKLHIKIIRSEEYQKLKAIDLGRYVTLLLGASEHYYKIIGTPNTLNELLNNYTLKTKKGYINNSSVSLVDRIVKYSEQKEFNQVFLTEEVNPITKEIYEYETIELLQNGQLRFGIFDINGNRKSSADPNYTLAGKPAKCMWCHESAVNPTFTKQQNFTGYLSASQLENNLINYRDSNRILKLRLIGGVDFSQKQQHTLTELLYITFMEPSAERLSIEWNLPLIQVQNLLSSLPTHVYTEFPFLGNLYHRNDIENLAPFTSLAVSSNVREVSKNEVNHLN